MTAWKIYFWIYAILSLIGVIALIPSLPSFNFASWEGTAESILLIIATYTYVYKKTILPNIWKVVFFLMLAIWIIQILFYANIIPALTPYLKIFETSISQGFEGVAFSILISVPAFYAVYKLGFGKSS